MKVKGLIDEDWVNYKKPSMHIAFPRCSFKCDKECGRQVCQNSALANEKNIEITVDKIIDRYMTNPITKALVCGGLEPFDSWEDLQCLILNFRHLTSDPIIIYTGYEEEELKNNIEELKKFNNIIIKFGRYLPNQNSIYDELLGVVLASNNQHAKQIS